MSTADNSPQAAGGFEFVFPNDGDLVRDPLEIQQCGRGESDGDLESDSYSESDSDLESDTSGYSDSDTSGYSDSDSGGYSESDAGFGTDQRGSGTPRNNIGLAVALVAITVLSALR